MKKYTYDTLCFLLSRFLPVAFFVLLSLILSSNVSHSSQKISLQLAWKHQFQFAGYYAALHKGFYQEAGLDVVIVEGGVGKFAREEVLSGRSQYGVAGSELLLHRASGDPFVVLAPIFQHSPSIILAQAGQGISNLQSLIGRRVMLLPGKKDADILAAFLDEGISLDLITRLDQTYNINDLLENNTDAVSAYVTNEPWLLEQVGVEHVALSPKTYGVDFYGDCLFTNDAEIKENSDRVKAFLEASLRGWDYAMSHPEEIVDLLISQYNVKKNRDHLLYEAATIRKIMLPELVQIGQMNPGRWRHIADTYVKLGMLDRQIPLEDFLYQPQRFFDNRCLKRIALVLFGVILATGAWAAVLFSLNRKLAKEVNERKKTEKQLQEALLFKEKFLSESPVGMTVYDAITGECIAANDAIAELIGATVEQVLTQNFFYISSWESSGLLKMAKFVIKTKKKNHHIVSVLTSYDKEVTLDCHLAPFEFEQRQLLLITATDITQRVHVEKIIQAQRDKAERYLNLAGVMFIGLDCAGNVTLVNSKACEILGYTQQEIIGLNWLDNFILDGDKSRISSVFERLVAGDLDSVEYYENIVVSKNGGKKNIAWHNTYITEDNGTISGVLGSGEDITYKKALQGQLQQARKMESIGNLAGGIAHEFNNMLAIIMGNNELIMEEISPGSLAQESTEEIRIAGLRARDVVKQLLTFSRQDDAVNEVMDFEATVRESMNLIRSSTPANIIIKQVFGREIYPVYGNSTQINQVLINLCSNAVDALSERDGVIVVSLTNEAIDEYHAAPQDNLSPGQYVKLMISDNGIGMDGEVLERIFEPYYTTKDIGKGTGIGMALVHGIVEKHGGSIIVESEVGYGTRFTIFLPAQTDNGEDVVSVAPFGNESILYVDDEPLIAKLGERLLKSLGYQVESTTDPQVALTMIKENPHVFDLVITDMAMPNMTGDQLVVEILKVRKDMPTIICTGYSAKVSQNDAVDIGVSAYIMKPVNKTELGEVARKVLNGAKSSH